MALTETPRPDSRTRASDAPDDLLVCPLADDPDARPVLARHPLLRPLW